MNTAESVDTSERVRKVQDGELLNVYDFARELLNTNDLDPVYVVAHHAELTRFELQRWLLAYWCFYHVGTSSWILDWMRTAPDDSDPDWYYWEGMATAAGSKEWPRCHERRHFRGENARRSVEYLRGRGVDDLFAPFDGIGVPLAAKFVTEKVQEWVGFGPWIAFKVADMLDRLGYASVDFDLDTAMYDSPMEGASLLWEVEGEPKLKHEGAVAEWAVKRITGEVGGYFAPPIYERPIGLQEVETILCKWKSYVGGHYKPGEDVKGTRRGLLRFAKCPTAQRLLAAGKLGGLW